MSVVESAHICRSFWLFLLFHSSKIANYRLWILWTKIHRKKKIQLNQKSRFHSLTMEWCLCKWYMRMWACLCVLMVKQQICISINMCNINFFFCNQKDRFCRNMCFVLNELRKKSTNNNSTCNDDDVFVGSDDGDNVEWAKRRTFNFERLQLQRGRKMYQRQDSFAYVSRKFNKKSCCNYWCTHIRPALNCITLYSIKSIDQRRLNTYTKLTPNLEFRIDVWYCCCCCCYFRWW